MDYQTMMESFAEWMAVANTNGGNLFFTPNGVQVSIFFSQTRRYWRAREKKQTRMIMNSFHKIRWYVTRICSLDYQNFLSGSLSLRSHVFIAIPIITYVLRVLRNFFQRLIISSAAFIYIYCLRDADTLSVCHTLDYEYFRWRDLCIKPSYGYKTIIVRVCMCVICT